jgi:hypothetical protein
VRRRLAVLLIAGASAALVAAAIAQAPAEKSSAPVREWRKTIAIAAPEANQAAAADERFVYAIDNAVVAKYDRESGKRVAASTGPAKHLNSGFFWDGELYCAHSNYPRKPEQSEIKVLDPETMELTTFKDFGNFGGSLTWAIQRDGHWWCNFAHYGQDNAKSFVAQFDRKWNELSRFTYPAEMIAAFKNHSASGGIWLDDRLIVTDHDHRYLYELRLPSEGSVLELVARHNAPFTGQGIAHDPVTGGLVGIDRGKKQILFAELAEP